MFEKKNDGIREYCRKHGIFRTVKDFGGFLESSLMNLLQGKFSYKFHSCRE